MLRPPRLVVCNLGREPERMRDTVAAQEMKLRTPACLKLSVISKRTRLPPAAGRGSIGSDARPRSGHDARMAAGQNAGSLSASAAGLFPAGAWTCDRARDSSDLPGRICRHQHAGHLLTLRARPNLCSAWRQDGGITALRGGRSRKCIASGLGGAGTRVARGPLQRGRWSHLAAVFGGEPLAHAARSALKAQTEQVARARALWCPSAVVPAKLHVVRLSSPPIPTVTLTLSMRRCGGPWAPWPPTRPRWRCRLGTMPPSQSWRPRRPHRPRSPSKLFFLD
jgi:hypothetical protein